MCKKSRNLQRALTVGSTNLRFPCWIHESWRKLLTKESRSITSNLSKFIYFWGKYQILCRARRWWWFWKIYTHEMEEWHHACGYHTCMYVFFCTRKSLHKGKIRSLQSLCQEFFVKNLLNKMKILEWNGDLLEPVVEKNTTVIIETKFMLWLAVN